MTDERKLAPLTDEEESIYEWQLWVSGFDEEGQTILKNSSVLVSRCGGLGSVVAYELAAAGIGKLVIAHEGNVEHSDLNRQLLMTYNWLGKPRVESAKRRLMELNPKMEVVTLAENVNEENVEELVSQVDLIVDCAPLFEERFAMNRQAVLQNKPLVDCAMYELEAQITTIVPGETPCLACLYPQQPLAWKREFPVFGAVSGAVACLGAMEAIKMLCQLGKPLTGQMLTFDLRDMTFHKRSIQANSKCTVCGDLRESQ